MNTKTQSPKAKQFNDELNILLAKYQYRLLPKLQVTEDGMIPTIAIIDVLPPKGNQPVEPGEGTTGAITVKKFSEKEIAKIDETVKNIKSKK